MTVYIMDSLYFDGVAKIIPAEFANGSKMMLFYEKGSITNYDSAPLHTSGPKHKKKVEEVRRLLFVSITRSRDLLYITGQYVAYGSKEDRTYNQFLREVFEAEDIPYCPVDPNEDLKAQQRKNRAAARKKSRESAPGMTAAQKAEYNRQIKGAVQMSIFDTFAS